MAGNDSKSSTKSHEISSSTSPSFGNEGPSRSSSIDSAGNVIGDIILRVRRQVYLRVGVLGGMAMINIVFLSYYISNLLIGISKDVIAWLMILFTLPVFGLFLIKSSYPIKEAYKISFVDEVQSSLDTKIKEAQSQFSRGEFRHALESYKEVDEIYQRLINISEATPTISKEEKSELKLKLNEIQEPINDCRVGIANQDLQRAQNQLTEGNFVDAESIFVAVNHHLDDLDATDDLIKELRNQARSGALSARRNIATEKLQRAGELLDNSQFGRARIEFWKTIDYLADFDYNEEAVLELIETARRGYIQTRVGEIRSDLRSATDHYENGDFYEAREGFESALELLEEVREEASEHDLEEKVAEIDDLIESCENSADRARRALVDIDDQPSSNLDVPEGGVPDLAVEPPDVDFDVEPYQPVPPGVSDDLRSELPNHEILIERYGIGGNADVHKVQLAESDEVVALKVPRWEGTLNAEIAERFVREAQRWDRLDDDPYVVEVVDWGTQPYPWLFLEFMDGGDLSDRVGDLSVQASVSVLTDICNAVHHAHRHGVVHADLKPQNVMFSTNGGEETVKVGDWGLARLLLRHSTSLDQLTPEYAAPEQVDPDGSVAVPYTDVYQLGVVAYELFTGLQPFDYESKSAIVSAKQEGKTPPPPSERADVPVAVDDVLSTAMAYRKEDRYETVVNFRNDLEHVMDAI